MKHELFALEQASVFSQDYQVFNDFNLHIYQGEILGILCDSILQEQTLVDLFRGNCRIEGTLRFFRKTSSHPFRSSMYHDTFFIIGETSSLISSLSISENICIFLDRQLFVPSSLYKKKTREYLAQFHINLDIDRPVHTLKNWEKILVLLLKAYASQYRIIVLVKLSEQLTDSEYEPVYQMIRQMIPKGFTFVVIDSIESNIFHSSDKVMVIRQGTSIASFDVSLFNRQALTNYMFQPHLSSISDTSLFSDQMDDLDESDSYFVMDHVSTKLLRDISLSAAKGELLKILCLDHITFRAFRSLADQNIGIMQGTIQIGEERYAPGASGRHGLTTFMEGTTSFYNQIQWCPEYPYQNAIVRSMSIRDNLMLPLSKKVAGIWWYRDFTKNIDQFIHRNLGISHPGRKAWNYSYETLQKVVYMRFLISAPKVLIVENPFIDTNIQIRETTLEMLRLLQRRGITIILLISTPSNLSLIDGEDLYAKNGAIISEEEMYQSFYGE